MANYAEDFSVATWDKNGGTCTVSANSVVAPDGNQTADAVTASGNAGLIRQSIAALVANGQYTFYVWLKVPSGTMAVSLGILEQRMDDVAGRANARNAYHLVAAV